MSDKRWKFLSTFIIGDQDNPMMKRLRVIQTPWFGIYVHFIYREDLDRDPHDHPWNFWRMVLKGGYVENYYIDPMYGKGHPQVIMPWRPRFFPTQHAHRIISVKPGTVSLVLVGRKNRQWGFWTPEDLVAWRDSRAWVNSEHYSAIKGSEVTLSEGPPRARRGSR